MTCVSRGERCGTETCNLGDVNRAIKHFGIGGGCRSVHCVADRSSDDRWGSRQGEGLLCIRFHGDVWHGDPILVIELRVASEHGAHSSGEVFVIA